MMKMGVNKIIVGISAVLLLLTAVIFFAFNRKWNLEEQKLTKGIEIKKTWQLPRILKEVSGIAFLDDGRIAAVQDEKGIVYIFNPNTSEIEERIEFGGGGDYEGIAVNGTSLYIVNSKGSLYIIKNAFSKPEISEVETSLTSDNNVEGLFYDESRGGLLLALKSKDPFSNSYKGIYHFDLKEKKLKKEPVVRIDFEDKIFDDIRTDELQKTFYPSEVGKNQSNGKFFILEAETPRLLVLDSSGKADKLYNLNPNDFPQPEGIAFDSNGRLYISNEGNPATIHQVNLK